MSAASQPRRCLVIANPIAGRGRGAAVARELSRRLADFGYEVEERLTSARGDAERWTRERAGEIGVVASVGGDGTLREVLEGLDDERVAVATAPLGTANVMSLDLALPREPERIAAAIAAGRTQAIDVARANGALSFLVTGVGLDAQAVHEVERVRRGPISKLAYVTAMLSSLRDYREPRLSVVLDGERVEGPVGMLLASNVIHYGGSFRLPAERRFDDGQFEVYLFRDARRIALARSAWRLWRGRELDETSCEVRRARRIEVRCDVPAPYHVDGDRGGVTPLELEVCGRRRLIVP